jgi:hypothetical protein
MELKRYSSSLFFFVAIEYEYKPHDVGPVCKSKKKLAKKDNT